MLIGRRGWGWVPGQEEQCCSVKSVCVFVHKNSNQSFSWFRATVVNPAAHTLTRLTHVQRHACDRPRGCCCCCECGWVAAHAAGSTRVQLCVLRQHQSRPVPKYVLLATAMQGCCMHLPIYSLCSFWYSRESYALSHTGGISTLAQAEQHWVRDPTTTMNT